MTASGDHVATEAGGERLLARLQEAEEVLAAIRDNRVDAFVVEGPSGKRIFTLEGADRPYRALIEEMHQGALTLDETGLVLYCNRRFTAMVGQERERIVASSVFEHVAASKRPVAEALLARADSGLAEGEILLAGVDGAEIPVYVSIERLPPEGGAAFSVVVTDISERIAHQELVATEELTRSILDQAVAAILVCDVHGLVVRCNQSARALCDKSPLHERFPDVLHLRPDQAAEVTATFREVLGGAESVGIQLQAQRDGDQTVELQLSAGPLRGPGGGVIGVVVALVDVTARVRGEAERTVLLASERAARSEAERASGLKDQFVAVLSHELRTPMNAILGWAQILRKRGALEGDVARGIEVIERNARIQAQLIADLLDVSRMMAGKLRMEPRSVDLCEIIEAAVESVLPAAQAKDVNIHKSLEVMAGPVSGDPARLQQIIWNLLSNAVKFTPSGGQVRVRLDRQHRHAVITVSDNGRGIPAEFLPYVFDRFRQAESDTTRRAGGLGLGLAIVKQLVELHGGTVAASSEGEGRGAVFQVSLPVLAWSSESVRESPAQRSRGNDAVALHEVRVLLVDDDPDTRELVMRVLADCGAAVVTAGSAAEALQRLDQGVPHVLISDIGMPDQDGYDLIRTVRGRDVGAGGGVIAIALTAFARTEDRVRALRAGYQAHVAKPVDAVELVATVRELVRTRLKTRTGG